MKCARCDYTADNLTEHAFNASHMLCIVCQRRSLTEFEPQTCPTCVARVRADLADIVTGYTLLEPVGVVALTLLGDGTMQRLPHRYELDTWGLPMRDQIRDEWVSDPLPAVAALASWEDFWREDFGDPTGPRATLSGVIDYLTRNLDTGHRAAQMHPAFDEFATEVQRLRSAVQHSAGLADVQVAAGADCFDCGGPLLRTYQPAGNNGRRRLGFPWEGLTNDWTCGWCRRVYDQPSYFLALRAASSSWVPVPLAAETAQRSVWTVRSWVNRLQVASACRVSDRTVVVWWPDVSDRAFRHADDAASA